MRNTFIIVGIITSLSSFSVADKAPAATPQKAAAKGLPTDVWHNQLGSEMRVKVDAKGALTGTYQSCVGSGNHKPKQLSGFMIDDTVGFTVLFDDAGAITAWSGHVDGGKISTVWQLSYSDAGTEAWKRTWAGADTFEQGASPKVTNGTCH